MSNAATVEHGNASTIGGSERHVLCTMSGRITPAVVDTLILSIERFGWRRWWILDATAVASFAPSSIPAGVRLLERGKRTGMIGMIIVTNLPAARMAARTTSLAAGVQVHISGSVAEAVLYAASH